jgi:hypothetical protein
MSQLEITTTKKKLSKMLLYVSYFVKKNRWLNASFFSDEFDVPPFILSDSIPIFSYTVYNLGKEHGKYVAETKDALTCNIKYYSTKGIFNVPSGLPYQEYNLQYVTCELADANVYDKLINDDGLKDHELIKIKGRGCEHVRDHIINIKNMIPKILLMSGMNILLPELIYLIREFVVKLTINNYPKRTMELFNSRK